MLPQPRKYNHKGIRVDFIGDSGPFSRMGRSIGYHLSVSAARYLIDLGAPVFQFLGVEGIKAIRGVVCTHSHDDHRRWFTDLALFSYYTQDISHRLRLITTELLHEEFEKNSKGALERSLSADSRDVVEVPYDRFVEKVLLGPRSLYRVIMKRVGDDEFHWRVVDAVGELVDPSKAKVVVHPHANRPRLLFRDPVTNEWIEPESFYTYGDNRFYEENQNPYIDHEVGLEIRALKGPCWHGPPNFSIDTRTKNERLLFSSDTVYDVKLWESLTRDHRAPNLGMTRREFERSYIIYGDINDFIERTWSEERLHEAMTAYGEGIVVHDVDHDGSVVHTSYSNLESSGLKNLLLTHSPDEFVSRLPLTREGKSFCILKNQLYEIVEDTLYPYCADVFVKDYREFYVGFESPKGRHALVRTAKGLGIAHPTEAQSQEVLMRFDLYLDVDGQYYPVLNDPNGDYIRRKDGQVERVNYSKTGSRGIVVNDLRDQILQRITAGHPGK